MAGESIKPAAQEYLAERLNEDGLTYEQSLNREAAIALAPAVCKKVTETVFAICKEWNTVTKEKTFACKDTMMGDLRIRGAGREHQMIVRFEAAKRLVRIENTAREDFRTQGGAEHRRIRTGMGHAQCATDAQQ